MDEVKRIDRKLVYEGGIVNFYEDTMEMPSGHHAAWDYIEHKKGASCVIPVLADGRILMVRQFREAIDLNTLEIPAGAKTERNEPSEDCAARELEEETGYRAGKLTWLCRTATTPAFCNELLDIYVATDLVPTEQNLDEDEYLCVEKWELDELLEKIYAGELVDAKSVIAILAYRTKYIGK